MPGHMYRRIRVGKKYQAEVDNWESLGEVDGDVAEGGRPLADGEHPVAEGEASVAGDDHPAGEDEQQVEGDREDACWAPTGEVDEGELKNYLEHMRSNHGINEDVVRIFFHVLLYGFLL